MLKSAFALAMIPVLCASALPEIGPFPAAKPAQTPATPENAPPAAPVSGRENEAAAQPPEAPEALERCLRALKESGATFRQVKQEDGPGACGVEHPVELSAPVPGIRLAPPALLRCEAALAVVEWTREAVVPAAGRAFPDTRIETVANASSYICRNRNGATAGKVSEHARGNALDLSAIGLADGRSLAMKPRDGDSDIEGTFQRSLAATACLYFTTVLSPGSDAAHQDHLHVDVMARKGGYRYCR